MSLCAGFNGPPPHEKLFEQRFLYREQSLIYCFDGSEKLDMACIRAIQRHKAAIEEGT